jgi:hypothetical protein
MQFTFGIITDGKFPKRILDFIESVKSNNIPKDKYEIIVVGGKIIAEDNLKHIPFDESTKASWITKKKNLITDNAKFENIVYLHDYIILSRDWYDGFLKFGDDWDVCMNIISNQNGGRFRDWNLCINFIVKDAKLKCMFNRDLLLPYDVENVTKFQYISGSYWVAKKSTMQKFKLDENLSWGQGEDVEWSKRLIDSNVKYVMNPFSEVRINKEYKDPIFHLMSKEKADFLRNLC